MKNIENMKRGRGGRGRGRRRRKGTIRNMIEGSGSAEHVVNVKRGREGGRKEEGTC